MIKNIIFDIGGVLCDLRFPELIKSFGFSEEVCNRVYKATFQSDYWLKDFNLGIRSDEEIIDDMVKSDPEIQKEIRWFMANLRGGVIKRGYTDNFLQGFRDKGYNLYYLSDWPRTGMKCFWNELDFLGYMDGGLFSFREKLIKPDPEFFRLICKRYDLIPEETVFTDDILINVEGARSVGINGIHFTSKADFLKEFEKLL